MNPYVIWKAVIDPGEFYGRREEIREVVKLIRREYPECCPIVGPELIGKTSLLNFIAHPQGARSEFEYYFKDLEHIFVYINFQLLFHRESMSFFKFIFRYLAEKVQEMGKEEESLRKLYDQAMNSQELDEVKECLEKYISSLRYIIIFLFDDFDFIIDKLTYEDYLFLKALADQGKVSYITSTCHELDELGKREIYPFLRIFHSSVFLGLLPEKDAVEFIQKPALKEGVSFTDEDVRFVLRAAGQHPYFIKVVCNYLFEAKQRGDVDYSKIYSQAKQAARGVCASLWQGLADGGKKGLSVEHEFLLDLVKNHPRSDDEYLIYDLERRGLIRKDGNEDIRLFGDIFKDFVNEQGVSKVSNIWISSNRREVSIDSKSIYLSPCEFELFQFLFSHAGRVFSKEELLQVVWREHKLSLGAVDMTLKRLREKIEDNPKEPAHIITVWGKGYMFQ